MLSQEGVHPDIIACRTEEALSPEIRRLLLQTLKIKDSHVPLHRIVDILATEDGDVSQAVNRFRDVKNQELRRAFHKIKGRRL